MVRRSNNTVKLALMCKAREQETYADGENRALWLAELIDGARRLPMEDQIEIYEEALKKYA